MLDRFDHQDHPCAAYVEYLRSVVMYFTPKCWLDFMQFVTLYTQRLYHEMYHADATVVNTNPAGSLETPNKIPDGSLTILRTAAERAALVSTTAPPVSKPTDGDADADADAEDEDEDHGQAGDAPHGDGSDDA